MVSTGRYLTLRIRESPERAFQDSEDPDVMPQNAAFNLGLHFL